MTLLVIGFEERCSVNEVHCLQSMFRPNSADRLAIERTVSVKTRRPSLEQTKKKGVLAKTQKVSAKTAKKSCEKTRFSDSLREEATDVLLWRQSEHPYCVAPHSESNHGRQPLSLIFKTGTSNSSSRRTGRLH